MRTFRMINTAEQHQISGLGFITTPDAFIPWRGVKVSGIVLFLKLMTLSKNSYYSFPCAPSNSPKVSFHKCL